MIYRDALDTIIVNFYQFYYFETGKILKHIINYQNDNKLVALSK